MPGGSVLVLGDLASGVVALVQETVLAFKIWRNRTWCRGVSVDGHNPGGKGWHQYAGGTISYCALCWVLVKLFRTVVFSTFVERPEPPVLKHGPRSVITLQVEGLLNLFATAKAICAKVTLGEPATQAGTLIASGSRQSSVVTTRKIANYACRG